MEPSFGLSLVRSDGMRGFWSEIEMGWDGGGGRKGRAGGGGGCQGSSSRGVGALALRLFVWNKGVWLYLLGMVR